MIFIGSTPRVLAAALMLSIGLASQVASAQEAHSKIQPSLAYLELEYTVGENRPAVGTKAGAQGTGFLVSADGFILTSYHLLEGMIEDNGQNAVVKVWVGGPDGNPVVGDIVNATKPLDLLLLKIRPNPSEPYTPVSLGQAYLIDDDDELFTTGFHKDDDQGGVDTSKKRGYLNNREGPQDVGYVWSVDLNDIASGQSGSPVYLADGQVVGMIKGNNDDVDDLGYMIPIEYADGLIAHIRIAALTRTVDALMGGVGAPVAGDPPVIARLASIEARMKDVASKFEWSATYSGADGVILITYNKLIAGDPLIERIEYVITPYVKYQGQTIKESPLKRGGMDADQNDDAKGGKFTLPSIKVEMDGRKAGTSDDNGIPELEITISPYLAGSTEAIRTEVINIPTGEPR